MTPKEKAQELRDKFRSAIYKDMLTPANIDFKREAFRNEQGKACALIHVDGILNAIEVPGESYPFWQQVKQEIEKL